MCVITVQFRGNAGLGDTPSKGLPQNQTKAHNLRPNQPRDQGYPKRLEGTKTEVFLRKVWNLRNICLQIMTRNLRLPNRRFTIPQGP
jgi:hypothetical protein